MKCRCLRSSEGLRSIARTALFPPVPALTTPRLLHILEAAADRSVALARPVACPVQKRTLDAKWGVELVTAAPCASAPASPHLPSLALFLLLPFVPAFAGQPTVPPVCNRGLIPPPGHAALCPGLRSSRCPCSLAYERCSLPQAVQHMGSRQLRASNR